MMNEREKLIEIIWKNFQSVEPPKSYTLFDLESSRLIEIDLKGKENKTLSAEDGSNICFDVKEMTDEALLYYIPRVMELILKGKIASVDFLVRSLTNQGETRLKQAKLVHIETIVLFIEYYISEIDFDEELCSCLPIWKKRLNDFQK